MKKKSRTNWKKTGKLAINSIYKNLLNNTGLQIANIYKDTHKLIIKETAKANTLIWKERNEWLHEKYSWSKDLNKYVSIL